jgi:hypothetical protein
VSRFARTAAVLAAAASIALTASPAMAAPAADKDLCKSGGFASYVNPATGTPFANQSQCVSFVNKGGKLTAVVVTPPPVEEVLAAPRIFLAWDNYEPTTGTFPVSFEAWGVAGSAYTLGFATGDYQDTRELRADAEGVLRTTPIVVLPGGALTISYRGEIVSSVTVPNAPKIEITYVPSSTPGFCDYKIRFSGFKVGNLDVRTYNVAPDGTETIASNRPVNVQPDGTSGSEGTYRTGETHRIEAGSASLTTTVPVCERLD